jgi:hypothetical protein
MMRRAEDRREGWRDFRRASSGRGKGRLGIRRHGGWFEAMNRYCVLLGTNLDEEGMRGSTKNFVRAGIGRSEGRM